MDVSTEVPVGFGLELDHPVYEFASGVADTDCSEFHNRRFG
jgi:hypothetical protein